MSSPRTAVILAEDLQAQVVLRRLLRKKWGHRFPRIRVLPLPAGKRCGSQYVRERYAAEVRAQRTASVAQVLVVHVDGDNVGLAARAAELATELAKGHHAPRGSAEPIAHVIPCWETETWILHARGEAVVEAEPARRKFQGNEGEAADPLVDLLAALASNAAEAPPHLPALAAVVAELRRL